MKATIKIEKIEVSGELDPVTKDTIRASHIVAAFEKSKHLKGDKISFVPEVKIKRSTDTLYISEMRKTKVNHVVVVEVFHPENGSDKAPMPLGALDNHSLMGLYIRLSA